MTKPYATDTALATLAAEVFTLIDPEALAEDDELLLKARELRDALAAGAQACARASAHAEIDAQVIGDPDSLAGREARFPLLEMDLSHNEIEDCLGVLDVVHNLLSEDETGEAAGPAEKILGYIRRDLRREVKRCIRLKAIASAELHRFNYPEQYDANGEQLPQYCLDRCHAPSSG